MKINCSTELLSTACQNVQRAISGKTSIPALEGILFSARNGKVRLTGFDLDMGIITEVEAKVEQEGEIIINAKLLCDILRRLPSAAVTITVDSHNLCKIKSGDSEFSLVGIPANDYPELPTVSGGLPFAIKQGILRDMVKQTIFAVAVQDIKPVHKGIKFEVENNNLRLISCDGFRLAIRNEAIEYAGDDMTFVVPAKTLSEVVKLADDDEQNITFVIICKLANLCKCFCWNNECHILSCIFYCFVSDCKTEAVAGDKS
jgi:DNA polymerase-3 subunit beta